MIVLMAVKAMQRYCNKATIFKYQNKTLTFINILNKTLCIKTNYLN